MIKNIRVTIEAGKGHQSGVDHGPKPFDIITDRQIEIGQRNGEL